MSFDINLLVKENIKKLAPYASARDEFSGEANIFSGCQRKQFGVRVRKGLHPLSGPAPEKAKRKNRSNKTSRFQKHLPWKW